jgi:hypothetical protein
LRHEAQTQKEVGRMKRNVIFCAECWKVLESKHRHDFVQCGCPNQTFVDGGLEQYVRYGAVRPELLVPMKINEIEEYETLVGDEYKKNYLIGLYGVSRLNPDSYGSQVSRMRESVNKHYEEPEPSMAVESASKIKVGREPDGKKFTIIYEEFVRNPSSDAGYDREVKMKRVNFRKKEDKIWYSSANERESNINILFNFAGWPSERSHG